MDHNIALRDQKISSLLFKFSWPAMVAMLVNALYNIIDRIFVGRGVGSIAIAATTVAFPLMLILMATAMLIGIGATALISIRLGQQKPEEAEKIIGNAMVLLILLPLCLTGIYFAFTDPLLILFGADAKVLPYARDFTHIIMAGSAIGSLTMGMNNFIRAEGNPRMSMYTQVLGTIINIVLNYVFVFKLGLGIKGSALATVCGQTISAIWVLSYFIWGKSLLKIRIKNFRLQKSIITSIVAIGFAPFAMQMAASLQNVILNKTLMEYGGDVALSAIGIIMSVATLMFMPIVGLSQGAQPIIGYNYGAQQYARVKETLKIAIIAATCISVLGSAAIRIWPMQIVGMFSNGDIALTQLASNAMLVYLMAFPIVGFQIICSNYFQAVGKALQSGILALSRQILLFIPMLLILPHFWGIDGVWRTAPIADTLSVILTATIITLEMKKIAKLQQPKTTGQVE